MIRAALGLALALASAAASAQGLGVRADRGVPIEITARDGIEWRQEQRLYIARGDARAVQGETTVHGDVLSASYVQDAGGATEIRRLEANGHVRIVTPTRTAYGTRAIYDTEQRVFVLTGNPRLVAEDGQSVTARDSIEYWQDRELAVARGGAVAVSRGRTLQADTLTAYFEQGPDGKTRVRRIDALNNVVIAGDSEVVKGDRGAYDLGSGLARVVGNVSITRGPNHITGAVADVDLNSGVSRLAGDGTTTVRGLIVPSDAGVQRGRATGGG